MAAGRGCGPPKLSVWASLGSFCVSAAAPQAEKGKEEGSGDGCPREGVQGRGSLGRSGAQEGRVQEGGLGRGGSGAKGKKKRFQTPKIGLKWV